MTGDCFKQRCVWSSGGLSVSLSCTVGEGIKDQQEVTEHVAYDSDNLPPHFQGLVTGTNTTHTHTHTHTHVHKHPSEQSCQRQSDRIKRLRLMIKCVGVLFENYEPIWLCMCTWSVGVGVCVCAPLASSPPGHHMQSWEPRLAPSVGLMPSPSSWPLQASLFQQEPCRNTQPQTHTHIADTQTYSMQQETDTLDGAKTYQTMTKSPVLGKVLLKFILAD